MNGREYLAFTKKERNGVFALAAILIAIILLPRLFPKDRHEVSDPSPEELVRMLDKNHGENAYHGPVDSSYASRKNASIGYTKKTTNSFQFNHKDRQTYSSAVYKKKIQSVELNTADTTQLIALPFIGSKLASRIVLFRDRLGGFVAVQQLKEVYGIQDSVFQILQPYLKCDSRLVNKISLNTVEKEILQMHPYIRWKAANTIINYRGNHGNFRSIDDLFNIDNLDTIMIRKAEPYLNFN